MTYHINISIYENMKITADIIKSVSDITRLRTLMLLSRKELSVCQLMGIMEISQPLVSRNLSILSRAGFLAERKDGKLKFFRVREDIAPEQKAILNTLKRLFREDQKYKQDLAVLQECIEFQRKKGKCDMNTFYEFQEWRKKKNDLQL